MADLELVISADVADLISKMESATATIKSNVGQISETFEVASTQSSLFDDALGNNVVALDAEAQHVQNLRDKLLAAALAFKEAAAASDAIKAAPPVTSAGTADTGQAAANEARTTAALNEVAALQELNAVEQEVRAALAVTIPTIVEAGAAAEKAAIQYELFADAASGVTIADAAAPLADETGQMLLFTEAAQDATGQLDLFNVIASESAIAQRDAAASAGLYAINAKALTDALAFLNDTQAVTQASSEKVALAQRVVQQEAAKLAGAANLAAGGVKNLSVAENELAAATGNSNTRLAGAVASMAAVDAGAGRMAFTFRLLAGALPGIASAINLLFLPVLAITFVDIIASLADKFTKLEEEIRKAGEAWDELAADAARSAEATELQNLKLEDTIAKFAGGPNTNRIKEAALEADEAVRKLNEDLEKSDEKILELLETKGVTLWDSLITGAEYTGVTFDALKPKFEELALARAKLTSANTTVALSEQTLAADIKDGADQSVIVAETSARDLALVNEGAAEANVRAAKKAAETIVDTETKKWADAKELAVRGQSEAEVNAGKTSLEELRPAIPPISQEQADKQFALGEQALLAARKELDAAELHQQAILKQGELRSESAEGGNLAESYQRASQLGLEAVKDNEKQQQEIIAADKATAESKFKAAEDGAKAQIAATEIAGHSLAAATLSAIPLLIAAQEAKNAAELDAFNRGIENKKAAIEAANKIHAEEPDEQKRTLLLKQDESDYTTILETEVEKRNNVIRDGMTALLNIELEGQAKSLAAAKEHAQKVAQAYRQEEKLGAETGNLALRGINEQIRAEERLFSLGQKNKAEERAFLLEKKSQLEAQEVLAENAIRAEIAKEQAAQKPGGVFATTIQSPELQANTQTILRNIQALDTNTASIKSIPDILAGKLTLAGSAPHPTTTEAPSAGASAGVVFGGEGAREGQAKYVEFIQGKIDELSATGTDNVALVEYKRQLVLATEALKKYGGAPPPAAISPAPETSALPTVAASGAFSLPAIAPPPVTGAFSLPATTPPPAAQTPTQAPTTGAVQDTSAIEASDERVKNLQEQLIAVTDRWNAAVAQVEGAYDKLDISTNTFFLRLSHNVLDAGNSWKSVTAEFQLSWQNALTQTNNDFSKSVGQWVLHGGSFVRAMQNMGAQLVASLAEQWVKFGLVQAETWLFGTKAQQAAQTTQTTSTATGQTAQTATVVAGQSAQTAATGVGATARAAITTGETTHSIALTIAKTSAHIAGEIVGTAATAAGALARGVIETAEATHSIALTIAKTSAHIAGQIVGTAATAAGALARGVIETAEAIASIAKRAASAAAGAFSAMASIPYIGPILGAAAAAGTLAAVLALAGKFAQGGPVSGAGTATSDSIPAMLSNGEFVVSAKGAQGNMGLLERINKGEHFSHGGSVGLSSGFSHLAEGGKVGIESTSTASTSTVHNNARFQFHNEFNGARDPEALSEEVFKNFQKKLRRSGYQL